ncbi:AAA family ATPase [Burkholderia ubonensis]|uniref:AAA family ATPase n=1 Tax=Burkholderia ubonensis TaxID=101571 RepID=UPI0009B48D12|nr:AAA family ATPase [Burkholderia ubonensis]
MAKLDTPIYDPFRGLAMPKISSVTIRRFKRLEEIELPLSEVTLLIGANNAGKSSVLQAIHFAVSIAQSARLIGEGVAWQRDAFELSFNPSSYTQAWPPQL